MINARGIWLVLFAMLILLMAFSGAHAADAPVASYCQQIREVVSSIGKEEAERLARNYGATEQQIAEAKACLHQHHVRK